MTNETEPIPGPGDQRATVPKPGFSVPAGLVGLIFVCLGVFGVVGLVFLLVGTIVCLIGVFEKSETSKMFGFIGLLIAAALWMQLFARLSH